MKPNLKILLTILAFLYSCWIVFKRVFIVLFMVFFLLPVYFPTNKREDVLNSVKNYINKIKNSNFVSCV